MYFDNLKIRKQRSKEVLKDIKETIIDYATIGVIMSLLTAIIRPYVSVKQTIRESVIVFVFSTISGLILENFDIPFSVKVGICGTFGFFAVKLYNVLEVVFQQLKEKPEIIIDRLKK